MEETYINFQVGTQHYIGRQTSVSVNLSPPRKDLLLATIFHVMGNDTLNDIMSMWQDEHENDDVFSPKSIQTIIFTGDGFKEADLHSGRRDHNTTLVPVPNLNLPTGPYFIQGGFIYSVWKVYEDRQLAFTQALWPILWPYYSPFVQASTASTGYGTYGIAVPARSYTTVNGTRTILGSLRFSVEDSFHIDGIPTSLGNRAYCETYPNQTIAADVVDKLVLAGAVLVGKNRLSSFAMLEHPTHSVEYQAPFNPRGDGYLITGDSSGGSAAAIAAYDWLDFAICSDNGNTTGGVRVPAMQTGIFGFRPSTNLISGNGMVKSWPEMATPAWFGRDLHLFPHILDTLRTSGPEAQSSTEPVTEILYFNEGILKNEDPRQAKIMDEFLDDISTALGCPYRKVSFYHDWTITAPVEEKDLERYLDPILYQGWAWAYAAFHSFDEFRQKYQENNGHIPFVTMPVRQHWSQGSQISSEQYDEAMRRVSVFAKWFMDRYMQKSTLIASHISDVLPIYRDRCPDNIGVYTLPLSPLLKAPELTIPFGQASYESEITEKYEPMPVVASLIGYPGRDRELLEWTLEALQKSGRSTKLKTGKTFF